MCARLQTLLRPPKRRCLERLVSTCVPVTAECFWSQALRARQLGINTIVVLEQIEELPLALEAAARLRVRPALGVRSRLATHHKCAAAGCGFQIALLKRADITPMMCCCLLCMGRNGAS